MVIRLKEEGLPYTNTVTHSKWFVIQWVDSGLAIQ